MQNTIITIARAYGSGGRTIGKMLSKEMDFPYYDRNLIYMASDKSGINVQRFFEQDEKIRKAADLPHPVHYLKTIPENKPISHGLD